MEVKIIKTEEDYDLALAKFEKIFHAPADTKEGDEVVAIKTNNFIKFINP